MQGKIINGFEIKKRLGVGGMAEVWLAENEIHKEAAVKILNAELSRNEGIVERFRNEAEIMVKLNHPNIRQVYGYGSIDGRPAIIMEYLEGDDLKAKMKQGQRFTDEELVKWWNQLVDALKYTHKKGIVHRDIKPGNIFVDDNGDIKLLDFGIAKVRESISSTQTGQKLGTLMYMSPEQVKDSKHIDYHTDSYSLAVTFVHLITGKRPYDSDTSSDFEISEQIVYKPIDMSNVPDEWKEFLNMYLAKDPAQRPELKHFEPLAAEPKKTETPLNEPADDDENTIVDGADEQPWQEPEPSETPENQEIPEDSDTKKEPKKSNVGVWVVVIAIVAVTIGLLANKGVFSSEKSDPDTEWYMRCYTVNDYRQYISYYGHSAKHYYEAKSYIDRYVADSTSKAQKAESAKTAYMDIISLEFRNTDYDDNVITNVGQKLYASDVKFLSPVLKYNGILNENQDVKLYIKVLKPDGSLYTGENSPKNYSYSVDNTVYPGKNNAMFLSGWGSKDGGTYYEGTWTVELWYEGQRICKKEVVMYNKDSEIQATAAKTAYMDNIKVVFSNTDIDGNTLSEAGKTLYKSEIRYIKPILSYNSLLSTNKDITIYEKFIKPNGDLDKGSNSPEGYTRSENITVYSGKNKTYKLNGWGNNNGGTFSVGKWGYEIWYEGKLLYKTTFTIEEDVKVFTDNPSGGSTSNLTPLEKGNWKKAFEKCFEKGLVASTNLEYYKGQTNSSGKPDGWGIKTWSTNNSFYVGKFKDGKWSGKGTYFMTNGTLTLFENDVCYVGDWVDGWKVGHCTTYDKTGKLKYAGDIQKDKILNTYPTTGLGIYKYECIEYSGDEYYIGETKNGKADGWGLFIWNSGGLWYGRWKNGLRDGEGVYISLTGSITTGTWKGDKQQ